MPRKLNNDNNNNNCIKITLKLAAHSVQPGVSIFATNSEMTSLLSCMQNTNLFLKKKQKKLSVPTNVFPDALVFGVGEFEILRRRETKRILCTKTSSKQEFTTPLIETVSYAVWSVSVVASLFGMERRLVFCLPYTLSTPVAAATHLILAIFSA